MAQVTMELRNLLQTNFELFDFEYKFDDLSFKEEIEQAVIDYFYFYEIGQETADRFKHKFKTKWTRIIGYYNKLHNTTLLSYNPLINYSMTEALEELQNTNTNQSTTNNSESTGTSDLNNTTTNNLTQVDESVTSDYPQQSISVGDYLNGATNSNQTNTGTVNNEGLTSSKDNLKQDGTLGASTDNKRNYEKTIEGITGITYQDLIQKERDNLIRITNMIINDLKPLFILVY